MAHRGLLRPISVLFFLSGKSFSHPAIDLAELEVNREKQNNDQEQQYRQQIEASHSGTST
jgi:hypothetical protein